MKEPELKKCRDAESLKALYKRTNFSARRCPEWSGIKEIGEPGYPHAYAPGCSLFGNTSIQMANIYENGGNDAFFIQELVRLYKKGSLVFREESQ